MTETSIETIFNILYFLYLISKRKERKKTIKLTRTKLLTNLVYLIK
jgi:hypothetical protein